MGLCSTKQLPRALQIFHSKPLKEFVINVECKTPRVEKLNYEVRVCGDTTVADLKSMILQWAECPQEEQHLIYQGELLQDARVLSYYHMQDMDTLYFVRQQRPVLHIVAFDGRSFAVEHSPDETIHSIKQHIRNAGGEAIPMQRLVYDFQNLHDNARIKDYSIPENATLHLVSTMSRSTC